MIRTLAMAAGLAITATAAQGSFTGIRMIGNDAAVNAAASAAIGQSAIVLRVYAAFDGLGDVNATPGTPAADAALLNVALSSSFSNINVTNGTFFQDSLGSDTPSPSGFFPIQPSLEFDSFATVGEFNSDVTNISAEPGSSESTTNYTGGWFNANPPNGLGNAVTLADGSFGVVLFQFTILGSTAGSNGLDNFGAKGPLGTDPQGAPQDETTVFNDYLSGTFTTFSKNPGVPIRHIITLTKGAPPIPTPGTLALFGIAGLAATRRRR